MAQRSKDLEKNRKQEANAAKYLFLYPYQKRYFMLETALQKLINGCRRGDTSAQRALFDQHRQTLFLICLRYARDRPEAQDMLQEAFLAIFRDLGQYKGSGAFEAWLHRITVRTALQYLRRKNPLRFAEDYGALPTDTWAISPEADMNGEAILHLVQKLPPGCRAIFNLHCIEALSYPEIAAELGLTESSVRAQYTRACKHLRGWVERLLTSTL